MKDYKRLDHEDPGISGGDLAGAIMVFLAIILILAIGAAF